MHLPVRLHKYRILIREVVIFLVMLNHWGPQRWSAEPCRKCTGCMYIICVHSTLSYVLEWSSKEFKKRKGTLKKLRLELFQINKNFLQMKAQILR